MVFIDIVFILKKVKKYGIRVYILLVIGLWIYGDTFFMTISYQICEFGFTRLNFSVLAE